MIWFKIAHRNESRWIEFVTGTDQSPVAVESAPHSNTPRNRLTKKLTGLNQTMGTWRFNKSWRPEESARRGIFLIPLYHQIHWRKAHQLNFGRFISAAASPHVSHFHILKSRDVRFPRWYDWRPRSSLPDKSFLQFNSDVFYQPKEGYDRVVSQHDAEKPFTCCCQVISCIPLSRPSRWLLGFSGLRHKWRSVIVRRNIDSKECYRSTSLKLRWGNATT